MSWNDVQTPCIFRVLLDKTKICKLWECWCVTCQNISAQKLTFFGCIFHVTIMLSLFMQKVWNKKCYFSIRICTRVKKILRNGHRWCPKIDMAKPFCENRRGARCFAELYLNMEYRTMYGAIFSNMFIFSFLSCRSHVKWMKLWIRHHVCLFLSSVLKRTTRSPYQPNNDAI